MLDRVHRFGGGIARLATAIRTGDGDAVMELLRGGLDDVRWLDVDVAAEDALPQQHDFPGSCNHRAA